VGKPAYSKGSCRKVRRNPRGVPKISDEAIRKMIKRYPASRRREAMFTLGISGGIPISRIRRALEVKKNPSLSAARLRRQAEIMEMDERLVPSTMTYEDIKDDPKLIAHYKKIMTPMAWKQLVDDWIRSGIRSGSGRRDFVIPKESEYRRMVSQNPVAPSGYHYMPDGRLMADSEHSVSTNPRGIDPNLAYKKEYGWTFVEFLKKRLIPDLRESGMYATIADYQRGISLYNDKKGVLPSTQYLNYLKYLRETLIPDLKASGSDSTAADFERMYKMVLYTIDRHPKSRGR